MSEVSQTSRRSRALSRPPALAAILVAGFAVPAQADPSDYVFVPYADSGRLQLAYAAGSERERAGGSARSQSLTLGYVVTDRYSTQVYASWAADPGASMRYDEWAWLNQLTVTSPGAGNLEAAALCGIEKPHDTSEGTGLLCGALLQWDSDHVQVNVNPLLERHLHASEPSQTDLLYQWQVKTLVHRGLELGAQGLGELGRWNHWAPGSQQQHTLGPAFFAKWGLGGSRELTVDAAWLFGIGDGSARQTLRLRMQEQF